MKATIGQYADYLHLEWTLEPVRVRNPLWRRLLFCEPAYVWGSRWRVHDRLKEFQQDPQNFRLLPMYPKN